ncbi:cell wall integrity and stress response component 2 [Lactuca sativa]|uniref:Uncharacterized protein n=1 Tax=Lactuca sativa TaxID=4236 RepID=A0A9R1X3B2_LACSA|nr:cell wall integrity and stress response component 2 [Lactuca sativa]KAJ0199105.1 hypothetical protein LSAT_V11C600312250 [Lactuca sativa]
MDAATAAAESSTPTIPILRRRNSTGSPTVDTKAYHSSSSSSIATTTTATTSTSSSSSSSSSVDFELIAIKPTCYTSLRDILPSPTSFVQSPKAACSAVHSGYEISIKNHLVKQAAWAYLQPMSTFPEADGTTVLHRLWIQFSGAVLRLITATFDCLLQAGTTASKL